MSDNRPDWLKAAAYEMDFARTELNEIKKLQKRSNERMIVALDWLQKLGENLDKHIKYRGKSK